MSLRVIGYSKVEIVGQNSSVKYTQQVNQFWRAEVTDLPVRGSLFLLSGNDSVTPAAVRFFADVPHTLFTERGPLTKLPSNLRTFSCFDKEKNLFFKEPNMDEKKHFSCRPLWP